MLLPAKKVGPRARGRWDELVGGIVKERKRLCWYWCSRLPDLLLSECGFGGCNEREDDHEPVERASVHCLGPRSPNRTFEPSQLFLVQREAARRAGSLADSTELDVESGGNRATGYRKLNDEKLIEPQREPPARRFFQYRKPDPSVAILPFGAFESKTL